MPSERSAKSAIVVPKVVEATIVAQYRNGWNRSERIWAITSATSTARNMSVPAKKPQLSVIVTESPPVSPSVVAAILMIQKMRVTSGTLLSVCSAATCCIVTSLRGLPPPASRCICPTMPDHCARLRLRNLRIDKDQTKNDKWFGARRSRPVRARIGARLRRRPAGEAAVGGPEDFHLQRMALCDAAGMLRAAVAAGAGRQRAEKIDLGEEFDEIARPHRARLHEILVRVAGEAGAHEDVEHVVHVHLRVVHIHAARRCERPCQVRVAAVVIVATRQQTVRVGVAARADDVVDAAAVGVEAVPAERVVCDRRYWPQIRQRAPQPVAGAHMRAVQRAGLAAEETLAEVRGVP